MNEPLENTMLVKMDNEKKEEFMPISEAIMKTNNPEVLKSIREFLNKNPLDFYNYLVNPVDGTLKPVGEQQEMPNQIADDDTNKVLQPIPEQEKDYENVKIKRLTPPNQKGPNAFIQFSFLLTVSIAIALLLSVIFLVRH